MIAEIIYNLPSCQVCARAFLGFWAGLALYGGLLVNEGTGQVGGYEFGQVFTKHMFFGKDTPQYDRSRYTAMVACASEQTAHPDSHHPNAKICPVVYGFF